MLVGEDFDKISFEFNGFDLLEPNAFIGDTLLFLVASFLAIKTYSLYTKYKVPFFMYWFLFFIIFGTGFFAGGFGHLLFNYWGVEGKFVSWFFGIAAASLIELGIVQLFNSHKKLVTRIVYVKLAVSFIIETLIILQPAIHTNPSLGMLVPTFHSTFGLIIFLGVYGYKFSKALGPQLKYFYISVLILFPSVFFQLLKINPHQWFDRNDVGHLLLIVSLILYFKGVKGYSGIISKN